MSCSKTSGTLGISLLACSVAKVVITPRAKDAVNSSRVCENLPTEWTSSPALIGFETNGASKKLAGRWARP